MQFGVKEKLRAFAAFGIAATLVVGLVGYNSEQKLGDALTGVNIKMAALRNHMESDMMHDALRADVLSALRAAKSHDEAAHKQVVADIEEHIASFIDHVDQNAKAPLSDEIKAGVEDVRPALSAYADAAREITAAAFKDIDSAEAKMPVTGEVLQVRRARIIGAQGHSGDGNFPRVIECMASGMDMTPMSTKKVSLQELPANILNLQTDRSECKITYIAG